MHEELRDKDLESLCRAEETYHLLVVLCTEPEQRRTYEARLAAIRGEIARRGGTARQ